MRGRLSKKIERIILEAMDGEGKGWRLTPETASVVAAALKAVEEVEALVNRRSTKKNCSGPIK